VRTDQDITERKQVEQELAESEARYRALAESSPLAIFVNRNDTVFLANPACLKLFGASSPEELLGKPALELFDPDSRSLVRERIRVDSEEVPLVEVRILRLDGTPVDVEATASPFLDQGVKAIQVLLRDITERKQAEEELRESEARYRALAERSPLAVLVCRNDKDDDTVILVNAACVKLFGASSPEELIGRSAVELFHSNSRSLVRGPIHEATGEAVPFIEAQIVRCDGTALDVDIAAAPLLDQGLPVTQVVLRDITELKKAHEQAARLAAIVTSSPDAIFTKDLDEVITSWNPAAEALYGYTAEEIIGRGMDVLMAPGLEDEPKRLAEQLLKGEKVERFETQRKRKDGSLVDVALSLFPVRNDAGKTVAISVMAQDITERERAEAELRESESRYRLLVENAPVAVFVQQDGLVAYLNPIGVRLFGAAGSDEVIGTPVLDLIHPDCRDFVRERIAGLIDMVEGPPLEQKYLRLDGSAVDVEVHAKPIVYRGRPACQVIAQDITERKQAAEMLRQAQEKFVTAFRASPDSLTITRLSDGEFLDVNKGYERMFGYTRAESIGKTTVGLSVYADPDTRLRLVTLLREAGEVTDFESTLRRKDGTLFTGSCSAQVLEIQGEECFVSVVRDISERKKAEDAVRTSEAKLNEAQRIGRIGSFDWDARTGTTTWSAETYRLYDRGPKEKPPTYEERLKMCTPESAARLDAATKRSAQTGEPYVLDVEEVRSDGTRRWVTSRGEATRDPDGTVIGLHGTVQDITESKKAHEQAARLAAIVTSSPDALVTKGLDEAVTSWNPAAEALYGYTAEEIIGGGMDVLMPPGLEDEPKRLTENILKGEKVERFETQRKRKDGSLVDVALTLFPVRNDAGKTVAISVVAQDITERERAEAERLQAEKFFRDTFEHADVGIAHVSSTDGTWLRVNQRLCDMLGYSREALLATTFAALTHPDDVDENTAAFRRMLAGEQSSYVADKRYLRKDGSIIWAHLNIVQIRKEDGTPDYNLDVLTDITERKQAEEALAASQRFSSHLLDTTPTLVYIYDLVETRNVYANREVTELLGYTPEEMLAFGSALFERLLHPDDAALVAERNERLHKLPPGDDSVLEVDYRMKHSDGEWRWLHSRGVPFARDNTGVVTQILGSAVDFTELKKAHDQVAHLAAIVISSLDAIITKDLDETITSWNPAAEALYGYTAEEIIGSGIDVLMPPGHEGEPKRITERLRQGEQIRAFDTQRRRKDGSVFDVAFTAFPILDDAGGMAAISSMTRDITDREAAAELAVRQAERIERTLTSVIDITSNIVELRDPYTAGHQRRVSELAVRIAEKLGASGHEVDDIRVAGLLHDIGKAGIPTEILSKPGELSPIEFTLIKGHVEAGYRLAVSANMAEPIAEMIYQHHERCDGSGYPRGLTGDQTLLGSKVLAVADTVEAMMSHRPYRSALGIKAALAEIERGAGTLYDAWVVEACVRLFNEDGFEFPA
jgi:PAS domain S-box-containing protein/putative nucleotidyltransferase with HDIG domain